jgi:hypothetical protein
MVTRFDRSLGVFDIRTRPNLDSSYRVTTLIKFRCRREHAPVGNGKCLRSLVCM